MLEIRLKARLLWVASTERSVQTSAVVVWRVWRHGEIGLLVVSFLLFLLNVFPKVLVVLSVGTVVYIDRGIQPLRQGIPSACGGVVWGVSVSRQSLFSIV